MLSTPSIVYCSNARGLRWSWPISTRLLYGTAMVASTLEWARTIGRWRSKQSNSHASKPTWPPVIAKRRLRSSVALSRMARTIRHVRHSLFFVSDRAALCRAGPATSRMRHCPLWRRQRHQSSAQPCRFFLIKHARHGWTMQNVRRFRRWLRPQRGLHCFRP